MQVFDGVAMKPLLQTVQVVWEEQVIQSDEHSSQILLAVFQK